MRMAEGKNWGPVLIILTFAFLLLTFSFSALAEVPIDTSPAVKIDTGERRSWDWWSFELKAGFWMPTNASTKKFIGQCCNVIYGIDGGFLYQGRYGVEAGVGFMNKSGNMIGASNGAQSQDSFKLMLFPMDTSFVWRMDYAVRQIVIPYVKTGVDYVYFRENDAGHIINGLKTGLHGTGGIALDIGAMIDDKTFGDEYSVKNLSVFIEARYNWINSFGKKGLNLSGPVYSMGMLMEF